MRKMLGVIGLCCVGCFFATFNLPSTLKAANSMYTRSCLVTDQGEGYVTIDTGSDTFEFEGDGFKMGQIVKVTFSDNNTTTVEDDIIIDVR